MQSLKNLKHHFNFPNMALVVAMGISGAVIVGSVNTAKPNLLIDPHATRAKEYRSTAELNQDASLIAVIEAVDGQITGTQFATANLPTSTFRVLKANDESITGKTISIVLPSGRNSSNSMRARKTLVWLIPLTFGNGVNENTWVVVGDGAGAYSTQGGQESGDMLYYREDGASQKLPNSVQIFEAKSNLSERPNR
jgi:hypothetical protein